MKSLMLSPIGSAGWVYQFQIVAPGVSVITFFNGNPAAAAPVQWSGWTVLNAGDQLELYITAQAAYYWVAGAVLPYATP